MFEELHGKFGDVVFREWFGKTLMTRPPDMRGIVPTARQLNQRQRFRLATVYSRMAFADQATRSLYAEAAAERRKPILSVMIADFLHAPSIDELDISAYEGRIGNPICVRARDDFLVQTVQIKIMDTDGQLLESGFAEIEAGAERWKYVGQTNISAAGNIRIQALVTDCPGNVTDKETTTAV